MDLIISQKSCQESPQKGQQKDNNVIIKSRNRLRGLFKGRVKIAQLNELSALRCWFYLSMVCFLINAAENV